MVTVGNYETTSPTSMHPPASVVSVSRIEYKARYMAEYMPARRQELQDATALATRFGAPWTTEEDDHLVNGTGTVLARAVHLGRTYYACAARLAYLRDQGVATD